MRSVAQLVGVTVLLCAVLAPAASAAPPVAVTGPATEVTADSATIVASVNPGGEATTYEIEYGTQVAYGLKSATVAAGSGSTAADVSITLTGLAANTTYNYRLVARNGSGESVGGNRTLRTARLQRAPGISRVATSAVTLTAATITAIVNTRGQETAVHFEYGTTASYGAVTPPQTLVAGARALPVKADLRGLTANTRYHVRVVATNAAGTSRSTGRTFTTAPLPTNVTIRLSTARTVWGSGVTVTGTVTGSGQVPVVLERQDFPYDKPFYVIATDNAAASGAFRFTVPHLYATGRLRVVARTARPVASTARPVSIAPKVGIKMQQVGGRRVRITGTIWPSVPGARASLRRRTASGRWTLVQRVRTVSLAGNRSRYRFRALAQAARSGSYRVVVLPRGSGATASGQSRTIDIPGRR